MTIIKRKLNCQITILKLKYRQEKDFSISPKWGEFGLQKIDIYYRSKQSVIYNHQILNANELNRRISKIIKKLKAQCHKEEILLQAKKRQYELTLAL